jgi:hypothetical protein
MLTYDNWYNWEWKLGKDRPLNQFDQWLFKPKNINLDTSINFKQSTEKALELIYNTRSLPLGILYSGGLDSEIILKTALDMGIPVEAFTMRFLKNFNSHEIEYVESFAKTNNIRINCIDVDIHNWLFKKDYDYCYPSQVEKYQFAHAATPLHFFARNYIELHYGDFAIINGSGDVPLCLLPKKTKTTETEWGVGVAWDSQYKRLSLSDKYPEDVPLFFCYIPELQYNFLMEEEILNCIKPESKKLGVISSRHTLYHRLWPTLLKRQKYTGFEKINTTPVLRSTSQGGLEARTWYGYNEYLQFYRKSAQ